MTYNASPVLPERHRSARDALDHSCVRDRHRDLLAAVADGAVYIGSDDHDVYAWCRCWPPRHVPLATFTAIAGQRCTTEENFQAGKGLAGPRLHRQARRGGSARLTWRAEAYLGHNTEKDRQLHYRP
jgi:hypothetical protein